MSEFETRYFGELRTSGDGSTLTGYSVVYDRQSRDLGGFIEIVRPGALTRTLKEHPDVFALFNHKSDQVLGRTTAGTLRLNDTPKGLHTIIVLPDNTLGNDVRTSVQRGDINGMSFLFKCVKDNWRSGGAAGIVRELIDVDLFEVSVATVPAYPDTSVAVRSLEAWRSSSRPKPQSRSSDRDWRDSLETAKRRLAVAMDFPTPYQDELRRCRQKIVAGEVDVSEAPELAFDHLAWRRLRSIIYAPKRSTWPENDKRPGWAQPDFNRFWR